MINYSRIPLKVSAKYFAKTLCDNVTKASLIKSIFFEMALPSVAYKIDAYIKKCVQDSRFFFDVLKELAIFR